MARLTVSALGPFAVVLDDQPITHLVTGKVRALLAYLAVEASYPEGHLRRAHRREVLAGLLWPEWPERSARTNLRNALSNLRKAIGDRDASPPFLLVTRETIQFNAEGDCRVDVAAFRALVEGAPGGQAAISALEEAVGLYRGPFLEGFSVPDSPPFDDWVLGVRERLEHQFSTALQQLVREYEHLGQHERASEIARRRVALAPWQESAHQDLMRLLAQAGQRGAALAQYEACRRALREELDVAPGEETVRLYERIRDGELGPAPPPTSPPCQATGGRQGHGPHHAYEPQPSAQTVVDTPRGGGTPEGWAGERRTVTALVATVAGSTRHGEAIDVELRAEVMQRVLPLLDRETARYGGEVDRYRDDGLVVLFGASTVHEDDAERTVLAALAAAEAIAPYAGELAGREGVALSLCVGVNTGEVIAAPAGGRTQYWEASATERALALARQAAGVADAVVVRVGESTYRLVGPLFEWDAPAEVAVAGEGEGAVAYRPLRRKGLPGKGRGIEGLASPLVGRDAELQALREAIDRLQSGIGGIVTVVGEAGIGKSRLVAECRGGVIPPLQDEREPSLQWLEGRCLSYAANVAYHLWLDMLSGWLGLAPDASPVTVRRSRAEILHERVRALCPDCGDEVYPYLGRMMGLPLEEEVGAGLRGLDAESLRYLTFRAVETILAGAAAECPLVVVCEDLHWADPTSPALLEHLLPLADRAPVLFVCILRPERAHGCWQIVVTAGRDYPHCHTDLQLEPLSAAESAALVGNLLHIDDLPQALRARILDHAEGNPFYVEEILRALIDEGTVVYDAASGSWRATREVDDLAIPGTLHGVLAARIDRLPGETRRVLQQASVIGRIFSYPVLAAIHSPLSPAAADTVQGGGELAGRENLGASPLWPGTGGTGGGELLAHLVALERAQLIRARARLPERAYAFKHVLTQEAAYASLLRRERRVIHRRVAEALERLYPERLEEQLGLLAHHWEGAGEDERAVAYLQRAGEQAAAQYANEEAIGYLSRALALAPEDDLETRFALLLAREAIYDAQGTREAQRQDLATLEELSQALEEDGKRAAVAFRRAFYAYTTSDHPAAIAAVQEAARLARAVGDAEREATALGLWSTLLRRLGDAQAAVRQAEAALDLARAAGLRQVEARSLIGLSVILRSFESPAAGVACSEQALRIHRQVGYRVGEGNALEQLGAALLMQGDYDQARVRLQESLRICREIGHRRREAFALMWLGLVCADSGEYSQARGHLERALHIFGAMGDRFAQRTALSFLGRAAAAVGDYAKARACLEQAMGITQDAGLQNLPVGVFTLAWLALVAHYLGDDGAVLGMVTHAQPPDRGTRWLLGPSPSVALGHALAALGQIAGAADAYGQEVALLRERGLLYRAMDPLAGLARVAQTQGDLAGALVHVEAILRYLEARPALEGAMEPLRVYLTCYQVLQAHDDPRAEAVLEAGYRLLQARVANIDDEDLRRSYLENVPYHRELVAAWEEASG